MIPGVSGDLCEAQFSPQNWKDNGISEDHSVTQEDLSE